MMRSIVTVTLVLLAALAMATAAGCGNVSLRGQALSAAENSAMDAYQAAIRLQTSDRRPRTSDTASSPAVCGLQPEASSAAWVQPYLDENFKQWRLFVRSARNDLTWGPKLPGE